MGTFEEEFIRGVGKGIAVNRANQAVKAHKKIAKEAELTRKAQQQEAAYAAETAHEMRKQTASIERQERLVAETEREKQETEKKKQQLLNKELAAAEYKERVEATQRAIAKQAYKYETELTSIARAGVNTVDEYLDYLELSKSVYSMREENKDFLEEHFSREAVEGIDTVEEKAHQLRQSLQLSEFETTVDSIRENLQRQNQLKASLNEISAKRSEIAAMIQSNQKNEEGAQKKIVEARAKRKALTDEAAAGWANIIAKWKDQVSDSTLEALENKQPQDLSLESPPAADSAKRLACLVLIPAAVYCAVALSMPGSAGLI